jgi:pimeloyl-ACP methyl ester carboxylesterase
MPSRLIVFLNGLGLPQSSWFPVIAGLTESLPNQRPPLLTYDRFGQGTSPDPDPSDAAAVDPLHRHDCMSVVRDLRQLITQIADEKLDIIDVGRVELLFVCNSIGCVLARLYAQGYPGTVATMLLLDSNMANSDFVSIWPDPDTTGFDKNDLPEGITPEILSQTREKYRHMFHPDVGSREGLSRRNLRELLPTCDSPVLQGVRGQGPFITVVGHDFLAFARENEGMGVPQATALHYTNPYWHRYNEGLTRLTEKPRSKGPVQAPGSGHFVQRDNPAFVVAEIVELLDKLE